MQHTNPGHIELRFPEGRRSIELVENRQEIWMSSVLRSLASIGELNRFSSVVQLSELIYVILRL